MSEQLPILNITESNLFLSNEFLRNFPLDPIFSREYPIILGVELSEQWGAPAGGNYRVRKLSTNDDLNEIMNSLLCVYPLEQPRFSSEELIPNRAYYLEDSHTGDSLYLFDTSLTLGQILQVDENIALEPVGAHDLSDEFQGAVRAIAYSEYAIDNGVNFGIFSLS